MQAYQNPTIRHIAMAIARIHNCERDAGFRSLNFAFKQCDLNDIDVLSVKVWIPWAVFLLPLSLSQSIILYDDKKYHDATTRVDELVVAADDEPIYYTILAHILHDRIRRMLLIFSAEPALFSPSSRVDRAWPRACDSPVRTTCTGSGPTSYGPSSRRDHS